MRQPKSTYSPFHGIKVPRDHFHLDTARPYRTPQNAFDRLANTDLSRDAQTENELLQMLWEKHGVDLPRRNSVSTPCLWDMQTTLAHLTAEEHDLLLEELEAKRELAAIHAAEVKRFSQIELTDQDLHEPAQDPQEPIPNAKKFLNEYLQLPPQEMALALMLVDKDVLNYLKEGRSTRKIRNELAESHDLGKKTALAIYLANEHVEFLWDQRTKAARTTPDDSREHRHRVGKPVLAGHTNASPRNNWPRL